MIRGSTLAKDAERGTDSAADPLPTIHIVASRSHQIEIMKLSDASSLDRRIEVLISEDSMVYTASINNQPR
jgi:hypothetical protein